MSPLIGQDDEISKNLESYLELHPSKWTAVLFLQLIQMSLTQDAKVLMLNEKLAFQIRNYFQNLPLFQKHTVV